MASSQFVLCMTAKLGETRRLPQSRRNEGLGSCNEGPVQPVTPRCERGIRGPYSGMTTHRPVRWWTVGAAFSAVALLLGVLEGTEIYLGRIGRNLHPTEFTWILGHIMPPWILVAVLAPLAVWMALRFPLQRLAWRTPLIHLAAGALFALVRLTGLAALHVLLHHASGFREDAIEQLSNYFVWDFIIYWCVVGATQGLALAHEAREARHLSPSRPHEGIRFVVKTGDRTTVVPAEDVRCIEGARYYARLRENGKAHLIRETMDSLARRLDPSVFLRTHRSSIVNLSWVREVQQRRTGSHIAVLKDGTRVPVSRSRLTELISTLNRSRDAVAT